MAAKNKESSDDRGQKDKQGSKGMSVGEETIESHGFCYVCSKHIEYPPIKVPEQGQDENSSGAGKVVREVFFDYIYMHNICAFRYLWQIVGASVVEEVFTKRVTSLLTKRWAFWQWLKNFGCVNVPIENELDIGHKVRLNIEKEEDIPDGMIWNYRTQQFEKRKSSNE